VITARQAESMIKKFKEDVNEFQALAVCMKCGSTYVDLNSPTVLECCNCGNTVEWNPTRFTISRDADILHDVKMGIDAANVGVGESLMNLVTS